MYAHSLLHHLLECPFACSPPTDAVYQCALVATSKIFTSLHVTFNYTVQIMLSSVEPHMHLPYSRKKAPTLEKAPSTYFGPTFCIGSTHPWCMANGECLHKVLRSTASSAICTSEVRNLLKGSFV